MNEDFIEEQQDEIEGMIYFINKLLESEFKDENLSLNAFNTLSSIKEKLIKMYSDLNDVKDALEDLDE